MINIRFQKVLNQISLGILLLMILSSCEKFDNISHNPNLKLSFSSDTIVFDTVFTSIGSVTKKLLIYNSTSENLNIEEISLGLQDASPYRINVDGISKTSITNQELRSHDSLYIFIRVLIDPNDQNSPFIVEDEIKFLTNENHQSIKLISWGQNAHYIIADQRTSDGISYKSIAQAGQAIIWDRTKPYLIYGYARVDSASSLLIKEGTQIHFHTNSGLWIENEAQLKVEGSLENRVVFQGDRLDEDYIDITNQWNKIWIEGSKEKHQINYAIIKNGSTGLHLTNNTGNDASFEITNSIIENMSAYSIKTSNFSIQAHNNQINDAGQSLLDIAGSGNLRFIHCTFVNYWQHSFRNNPSIQIDGETAENLIVYFGNSIIDGNKLNELLISNAGNPSFEYAFDYCSLKTDLSLDNESNYKNIIKNPSDLFADSESMLYLLSATSEVIDQGKLSLGLEFPFDILNNNRSISPDLGAFEYIDMTQSKY